jgi:hypothetical protein
MEARAAPPGDPEVTGQPRPRASVWGDAWRAPQGGPLSLCAWPRAEPGWRARADDHPHRVPHARRRAAAAVRHQGARIPGGHARARAEEVRGPAPARPAVPLGAVAPLFCVAALSSEQRLPRASAAAKRCEAWGALIRTVVANACFGMRGSAPLESGPHRVARALQARQLGHA